MTFLRKILTRLRRPPAGPPLEPATCAVPAVLHHTTRPSADAKESQPAGARATGTVGFRPVGGGSGAVPLVALAPGQTARLIRVDAARRLQRRLLALGLTPGTPLWLVSSVGGPVIVAVRATRLALGREIARRIWVVPEDRGPEDRATGADRP